MLHVLVPGDVVYCHFGGCMRTQQQPVVIHCVRGSLTAGLVMMLKEVDLTQTTKDPMMPVN